MEWQKIVMDLIVVVFMALTGYVWKAHVMPFITGYVKPWIIEHNLAEASRMAVLFAESVWGRGHGREKLQSALDQLAQKGWDIDSAVVLGAIEAAWQELNIAQVGAGIKGYSLEGVDAESQE